MKTEKRFCVFRRLAPRAKTVSRPRFQTGGRLFLKGKFRTIDPAFGTVGGAATTAALYDRTTTSRWRICFSATNNPSTVSRETAADTPLEGRR